MLYNKVLLQYVHELFEWVHETKAGLAFMRSESLQRTEEQSEWEKELEQMAKEIEALQLLPADSPGIHEKIAIVREKSERIYQQIISLWHKYQDIMEQKIPSERQWIMKNPYPTGRVPIGEHTLPPLPYPYDALEPYIDRETMRLHHDKHHQSYVDGLNKAEKKMAEARRTGNYDLLIHWEREAAFHGAGHYLHTIFWNIMSPTGGGKPTGNIARQINEDFGSFEKFKEHFTNAANQVEGVGWSILVWSPRAHRLEILQAEKHQLLSQWDVVPLLVLDVWEHAYYLKYKNERKKYVDNWWNVVNWSHVNERFNQAKELKWEPY